jgi:ankyrin repeat protein
MKNKKLLLMGLMLFAGAQKAFASSREVNPGKVPCCACLYKASYKLRTAFSCRYSAWDLYYAIQTEDYDRLEGLLKRTNIQSPAVQRLVFTAIANNDERALGMLLDAGVDVNYTDAKNQMPPLTYAVYYKPASVNILTYTGHAPSGNNGIVNFLLGRDGIDVNKLDGQRRSALNMAMGPRLKYWDTAVLLLQAGINPNHSPGAGGSNLEDAVDSGNQELVKELIDRGFDLPGNGYTALRSAVRSNNTALVVEITKAARDNGDATLKVNLTEAQLHGLLFEAVSNNNPQIFGSLSASFVEMAIDYNYQQGRSRDTMLHKAVRAYSPDGRFLSGTNTLPMINMLLGYGANPNITNRARRTPMDLAGENQNVRTRLAAAAAQALVAE